MSCRLQAPLSSIRFDHVHLFSRDHHKITHSTHLPLFLSSLSLSFSASAPLTMATSTSFSTFSILSQHKSRSVPTVICSLSPPPSHSPLSQSTLSCQNLSNFQPLNKYNFSKRPGVSSKFSVQASADKKKVLIVNTNSGGHAVIGFYFAKELLANGHEVTVLTVGEEGSSKMKKPPFTRFSELVSAGGKTIWGEPSEVEKVVNGATFDVVLDNNGKNLDTVKPVADWAKSSNVSQFLFISSAGIYKTSDEVPHVEGDPVKEDAGHVAVEKYIASLSFPSWAAFRPQYMIGSGNNKDCEEWFFDRIVRNRPVPIPGSGMQLTIISHVRDLSSMLTLAVGKPGAANGKIFNCVCDRAVTFNGLAKLCAEAAGSELKIVYFDPKEAGVDAKKAFPFRNMHFYAEPRAAKEILGWKSTTNLPEDLKERFAEYVSIGRDKKEITFEVDDKILDFLNVSTVVPASVTV